MRVFCVLNVGNMYVYVQPHFRFKKREACVEHECITEKYVRMCIIEF